MGLPLSSRPFVNIATVDQWEFWQEKKSHQRLAFCLKKKKVLLMQKILTLEAFVRGLTHGPPVLAVLPVL